MYPDRRPRECLGSPFEVPISLLSRTQLRALAEPARHIVAERKRWQTAAAASAETSFNCSFDANLLTETSHDPLINVRFLREKIASTHRAVIFLPC
jgi:hypothetical protein